MPDDPFGVTSGPIVLELSGTDRATINATMQHWLSAVNKNVVPNLQQLVSDFRQKLTRLSLNMTLQYEWNDGKDSQLVAEATGEAAITLQQIRAGSLWFPAWKNFEYEVMAALDSPGTLPHKYKVITDTLATNDGTTGIGV